MAVVFNNDAGPRLVRHGRVVECQGEPVVRFPPGCGASATGGAASPTGCAACGVAAASRQIPLRRLSGAAQVRVGDAVAVELDAALLTRAAAQVFGLPLAALLAGAWLGARASVWLSLPVDVAAAVAGLACLGIVLMAGARSGAATLAMAELRVSARTSFGIGERSSHGGRHSDRERTV